MISTRTRLRIERNAMNCIRILFPLVATFATLPAQDDKKPQDPPKSEPKAEAPAEQKPADDKAGKADKVDFVAQVLPILEKNCVECHKAPFTDADGKKKKPKGGVILDSREGIEKGKKGKLVVSKKPDDSMLYHSISLPADDDDRMPPAKKGDPLPKEQQDLIKKWIDQGADFGSWKGGDAKAGEKADSKSDGGKPADKGDGKGKGDGKEPAKDKGLALLEDGLSPLGDEALATLRQRFSVESIDHGSSLVRVTAYGRESATDDAAVATLALAKDHVAELVLARTHVTDAGLRSIAAMPRLVHLDLRATRVTDEGVRALAACKELRSCNLYGTNVGDEGIAALSACTKLEQLYVYATPASAQAIVALQQTLPQARIVFMADLPEPMADAEAGRNRRR